MPCASCCGLVPVGDCEPKISIMPITVPNRPSSGAAVAMVPSVVRKRSRSCATRAAGLLDRLLHHVARALVVAQARGEHRAERRVLGQLVEHVVGDALALVDRDHLLEQRAAARSCGRAATSKRSMIRASAMTEASSRGQIGQPAAWMMANNSFCLVFFWVQSRGDFKPNRRVAASFRSASTARRRRRRSRPRCSAIRDIHKYLWISLWIDAE